MLTIEELFEKKNLERIANLVCEVSKSYVESDLYKASYIRWERTQAMMDLRHYGDEYKGRYGVYFPIFKQATEMWQSTVRVNFRNDPFVSIVPEVGTSAEEAKPVQVFVNYNVRATDHKKEFHFTTDDACAFGTGVLKNLFMFIPKMYPQPVQTPLGEMEYQFVSEGVGHDFSVRVHPLNYFQDTLAIGNSFYMDSCRYVGEFVRFDVSEIYGMLDIQGSVPENIKKVLKSIKDDSEDKESETYYELTNQHSKSDTKRRPVGIHYYGVLPIKGNEDDLRRFHVVVSEKDRATLLIEETFDHPYTLVIGRQRRDNFMGVSPTQGICSMNLITNLMNEKGIENLINNLQRFIFYMKDAGINPRDLQTRPNNGFVPVDFRSAGVTQISQVLQEFQGRDINVQSMQAYMAMINDTVQRETHQSDLLNYGIKPSQGGGLNHAGYTATGANIMDERTQVPVSDFMEQLGISQEEHWNKKIRSIQMNTPDYIGHLVLGRNPEDFRKFMLMGAVRASVKSGLKTNKSNQLKILQDFFGFAAAVAPLAAQMGQPVNAQFQELLKTAGELADLPNKDRIFPDQPVAPAQPVQQEQIEGVVQ